MTRIYRFLSLTTALFALTAAPALADALRSNVAFNTGSGEKTADQPQDGVKVTYQVTLTGGDLDGCTIDIVESLFGRDEGAWGIFDIAGNVTCANGGFSYTSSGAWDGNGFHASGHVDEGSGSGDFEGIAGRIAQLNSGVVVKEDSSWDVSYELVVDKAS